MVMVQDTDITRTRNYNISNSDKIGKSIISSEPILYEHIRRLMNDISNYLSDNKLTKLLYALNDLYTLIRPRLKGKDDIRKDIEEKGQTARKVLSYTEEDIDKVDGVSYRDKLIKFKSLLYHRALPYILDYQTVLYDQLYELKLILGGDNNE